VTTSTPTAPAAARSAPGARSFGLRVGALFGPAIFGVTAAGVALPEVARALRASPAATAWVLTAHALALGIGTALSGRVADARGVRPVLLAGGGALAAGAAVCLAAPDLGTLVAGRFLLAAGSGAMTSAALALAAGSAPERRAAVLAVFGAVMSAFAAGATLAGGAVTQWLTWRLTLVLPVLSLLAIPLVLRQVPARPGSGRPVDLPGAALLTLTAASFLVLVQSSVLDLPAAAVVADAALLVLAGTGLVVRVRRVPEGFVPRAVAGDPVFVRAQITGAGVFGGMFGVMYAVPQLLVGEHGWSVLSIGGWLLPGAVVGAALSRYAVTRTGRSPALLLAGTALASSVTLAVVALVDAGPPLVLAGASLGFAAFAVTQVVTTGLLSARLDPRRRGGAMALLNLTFFLGGGTGSAVAGALAGSLDLTAVLGVVAAFPLAGALAALTLPAPAAARDAAGA
jgi:MFS family permease